MFATLTALGLFQAVLIAGAPIGRFAWGGAHRVLPTRLRIGSVISILLYALFALVVLDRAGIVALGLPQWAVWALAGYFLLGVGMNLISRSPPERYTMTPVALVLCVLCVIVALG